MKTLSLVFSAAFFTWAFLTARHDQVTSKIPNASIRRGLLLLAAGLAACGLLTAAGYYGLANSYMIGGFYQLLAVHFFWSAVAGAALWYAGIWPAGDAKFFMTVCAGLPLASPALPGFPNYFFLVVLANIFVAASVWTLVSFAATGLLGASPRGFLEQTWSDVKKRYWAALSGKSAAQAAGALIGLFLLFLVQRILTSEFFGFANSVLARTEILFFFMFMLWEKVLDLFKGRRAAMMAGACAAAWLLFALVWHKDRLLAEASMALHSVIRFSLLLFVGRSLLDFLLTKKDSRLLPPEELRAGMILSRRAADNLRTIKPLEGEFDDYFKDGLTEGQLAALRIWLAGIDTANAKVEIVVGRPFAAWIAAGAALSLLLNRNLAALLR